MDSSSVDEKHTPTPAVEQPPTAVDRGTEGQDSKNLDSAYLYLTQHDNGEETVNLKALRRKIDWWIVPITFACYTMQFIDKVMINVGRVSKPSFFSRMANML